MRWWSAANLVSNVGTWMQLTVQNLLVLQITGSAATTGLSLAVQAAPGLLLSLVGGSLVDSWPRKLTASVSQALLGLVAFATAAFVAFGMLTVPLLMVLAAVTGSIATVDNPACSLLGNDLVKRKDVPSAIALGSVVHSAGRLLGTAAAGAAVAWFGMASAYVVNGLSFLAVAAVIPFLKLAPQEEREAQTAHERAGASASAATAGATAAPGGVSPAKAGASAFAGGGGRPAGGGAGDGAGTRAEVRSGAEARSGAGIRSGGKFGLGGKFGFGGKAGLSGKAGFGGTREGLVYFARNPRLVALAAITGISAIFGRNYQLTLAVLVTGPLAAGAGSFSTVSTVLAVGGMAGAVLAGCLRKPSVRHVALLAAAGALLQVVAGFSPSLVFLVLLVAPMAVVESVSDTAGTTVLQTEPPAHMRGRVLGVWRSASTGWGLVGPPLLGALMEFGGARGGLIAGGLAIVLVTGLAQLLQRRPVRLPRPRSAATSAASVPAVLRPAPAASTME
ncbi:MFS transporter [Streptomyces albus]|uniref:MFS transporter n=1 Tax=Streptomyces albus TaxID=1888 RepID=UPI001FAC8B34|nr:MFS transporter [Streptomyces albus]